MNKLSFRYIRTIIDPMTRLTALETDITCRWFLCLGWNVGDRSIRIVHGSSSSSSSSN